MNLPKTLKTKVYLYRTPYTQEFIYSSTAGMDELSSWELLGEKEFELETPDLQDKDFLALKKEKLEKQKQAILEKAEVEIEAINDHLAQLAKL